MLNLARDFVNFTRCAVNLDTDFVNSDADFINFTHCAVNYGLNFPRRHACAAPRSACARQIDACARRRNACAPRIDACAGRRSDCARRIDACAEQIEAYAGRRLALVVPNNASDTRLGRGHRPECGCLTLAEIMATQCRDHGTRVVSVHYAFTDERRHCCAAAHRAVAPSQR